MGAVRTQIVRGDAAGTCRVVMGTGGYMAPEMLRGGAATAASDTYALGVTFFRLLTGLWYEPGTDAFRLLEPFGAVWTEALTRMLAADPARRPVRLMPLAERLKAAEGLETPASGRAKLCSPRWLPVVVAGLLLVGLSAWGAFRWLRGALSDAALYDHLYDIPTRLS